MPTDLIHRKPSCRLLFLLACLVAQSTIAAEQKILAFTHATVIDTTGAPARSDITVVITDDRITALGASAALQPPTNAIIVDATGKFLIPGLWDMHVHWYDREYLPLFPANGVTGIRMMVGVPVHHEWRKEIESGTLIGPRMYLASALVDGPNPIWPGSLVASNAVEGREAVRKSKQDNADFVKVYSLLPREAYFAIADECKKQGIPFAGHVPVSVSVEEASVAGQKTIEHLTGIFVGCSAQEEELLKSAPGLRENFIAHQRHEMEVAFKSYSVAKAGRVFAEFRTNQTWQCPTLTVLRLIPFGSYSSFTNDARLKYMPRSFTTMWARLNGRFTNAAAMAEFNREYFQKHLEVVGAMQRAGIGILAGTDTGNPYCLGGFSLHDELGLLVRAGLTPMEALQAATLNPARLMGRERELGTIEKGKLADLVLLEANPLDDIANTRKIAAVVFGGRLFPKSALDEMLKQIEALANK